MSRVDERLTNFREQYKKLQEEYRTVCKKQNILASALDEMKDKI